MRGAGYNGENTAKTAARSSRVRQGVNKRLVVNALFSLKKPVYSTSWHASYTKKDGHIPMTQ
jgi:hypothetical protein